MARLGAGTRKRADGTLEKRFTIDGKRYSIYGKNAKEISQKEQEIRKKIEAGIYTDNRNLTLDQYFAEWLTGKRNGTKGNTLKTYRSYYYKHISPQIGGRKVQQLERRESTKTFWGRGDKKAYNSKTSHLAGLKNVRSMVE